MDAWLYRHRTVIQFKQPRRLVIVGTTIGWSRSRSVNYHDGVDQRDCRFTKALFSKAVTLHMSYTL